MDADTGWHIRTGEHILATASVPRTDLFSFTKSGEPWFAWEWGADVIYALLHQLWGLKGVVILGAIQIGLFAILLLRFMLWRGANMLLALGVLLTCFGAATLHYLARPHLFTLLFVPISLWMLEADQRKSSARLWWLVPLTLVWTNLHGGFLAWIACLGLAVVGTAVECLLMPPEGRDWRPVWRYSLLGVTCGLATLVNPYGYQLHMHIVEYLRSDWIRNLIQEFQSPSFRTENMLQFELILLLGLMAAGSALANRRVTEALWILFWAHQSLASVRHATVFVAVAGPVVAVEATRWWNRFQTGAPKASVRKILDNLARDMSGNFGWTSVWPLIVIAALAMQEERVRWPKDFPEAMIPVRMVEKHQHLLVGRRVLTTDQWGDYLIYKFHPRTKVFFDGRSDFYGQKLGDDYVQVSHGHHEWRKILDRHQFEAALVPLEWPLASLLKLDPKWRLVDDDGKSLIFERIKLLSEFRTRAVPKKTRAGLMESNPPSEFSMGDLIGMKHGKQTPQGTASRERPTASEPSDWWLPSGQRLAEFALRGGFMAPNLLKKIDPGPQRGAKITVARSGKEREAAG